MSRTPEHKLRALELTVLEASGTLELEVEVVAALVADARQLRSVSDHLETVLTRKGREPIGGEVWIGGTR